MSTRKELGSRLCEKLMDIAEYIGDDLESMGTIEFFETVFVIKQEVENFLGLITEDYCESSCMFVSDSSNSDSETTGASSKTVNLKKMSASK